MPTRRSLFLAAAASAAIAVLAAPFAVLFWLDGKVTDVGATEAPHAAEPPVSAVEAPIPVERVRAPSVRVDGPPPRPVLSPRMSALLAADSALRSGASGTLHGDEGPAAFAPTRSIRLRTRSIRFSPGGQYLAMSHAQGVRVLDSVTTKFAATHKTSAPAGELTHVGDDRSIIVAVGGSHVRFGEPALTELSGASIRRRNGAISLTRRGVPDPFDDWLQAESTTASLKVGGTVRQMVEVGDQVAIVTEDEGGASLWRLDPNLELRLLGQGSELTILSPKLVADWRAEADLLEIRSLTSTVPERVVALGGGRRVAVSANGGRVLVDRGDGRMVALSSSESRLEGVLETDHGGTPVRRIAVSDDGSSIATTRGDFVEVYALPAAEPLVSEPPIEAAQPEAERPAPDPWPPESSPMFEIAFDEWLDARLRGHQRRWASHYAADFQGVDFDGRKTVRVGRNDWFKLRQSEFGHGVAEIHVRDLQVVLRGAVADLTFEEVSRIGAGLTRARRTMRLRNAGARAQIVSERLDREAHESVGGSALISDLDCVHVEPSCACGPDPDCVECRTEIGPDATIYNPGHLECGLTIESRLEEAMPVSLQIWTVEGEDQNRIAREDLILPLPARGTLDLDVRLDGIAQHIPTIGAVSVLDAEADPNRAIEPPLSATPADVTADDLAIDDEDDDDLDDDFDDDDWDIPVVSPASLVFVLSRGDRPEPIDRIAINGLLIGEPIDE